MPVTGVSGLDLYALDRHGRELHINRQAKVFGGDTLTYSFTPVVHENYVKVGYEFQLYLPLYNEVTFLEIGVDSSAQFEFLPLRTEKPIVAYGTSIMQGVCLSARYGLGNHNGPETGYAVAEFRIFGKRQDGLRDLGRARNHRCQPVHCRLPAKPYARI